MHECMYADGPTRNVDESSRITLTVTVIIQIAMPTHASFQD